jgi:hypothetical protein
LDAFVELTISKDCTHIMSMSEKTTTELQNQFQELQKKYQQLLPKVDPGLVNDLLLRQMENPGIVPMYMVEVFTKPGLNTEEVRSYIIGKTGMSPAIYDNGTHYVTNQKLTLDILKEISDSEDVIEVTGDYTGGLGGYGASHEQSHRHFSERRTASSITKAHDDALKGKANVIEKDDNDEGNHKNKIDYKIAAYTAAGIIGAIALVGFIISGGLLPNSSASQTIPAGTEPGAVHGYVTGPGGLPAVGATVLAAQQGNDFVASSFVSVTGQYDLDLPPGNYVIYVAYPDGTDKTATVDIQRGSLQELNFAY